MQHEDSSQNFTQIIDDIPTIQPAIATLSERTTDDLKVSLRELRDRAEVAGVASEAADSIASEIDAIKDELKSRINTVKREITNGVQEETVKANRFIDRSTAISIGVGALVGYFVAPFLKINRILGAGAGAAFVGFGGYQWAKGEAMKFVKEKESEFAAGRNTAFQRNIPRPIAGDKIFAGRDTQFKPKGAACLCPDGITPIECGNEANCPPSDDPSSAS